MCCTDKKLVLTSLVLQFYTTMCPIAEINDLYTNVNTFLKPMSFGPALIFHTISFERRPRVHCGVPTQQKTSRLFSSQTRTRSLFSVCPIRAQCGQVLKIYRHTLRVSCGPKTVHTNGTWPEYHLRPHSVQEGKKQSCHSAMLSVRLSVYLSVDNPSPSPNVIAGQLRQF